MSVTKHVRIEDKLYAELQAEAVAQFLSVSKYIELILRARAKKRPL